jgi:2-polyprenyl-3-methyl-5-hydroxy-6-metoxy-1,4-benzoquinol methylase
MTIHTGSSYDGKAEKYAKRVDRSPWNAHYERPAVVSLLPPLENARVLDVGCGSGWYTEYLSGHGAIVTAFDLNAEFVDLTKSRAGHHATVFQGDLSFSYALSQRLEGCIQRILPRPETPGSTCLLHTPSIQ